MKNIWIMIFLILTIVGQKGFSQTTLIIDGDPNARNPEIFLINAGVEEGVDVGLRLQVYENSTFSDRMIWNQLGTGALNFSLWQSTGTYRDNADENAVGDTQMKLTDEGQLAVSENLTIGSVDHVTGSALTIGGVTHITPYASTETIHATDTEFQDYFLLYVEEGIVSSAFAIADPDDWADYVFDENYELRELAQVAAFIEDEGHLPGIPSRTEIVDDGYSIHDMNTLFLEKIEELTLYTIDQRHMLNTIKAELNKKRQK